jgi:hypothetical protein
VLLFIVLPAQVQRVLAKVIKNINVFLLMTWPRVAEQVAPATSALLEIPTDTVNNN